jgi:hypothetical protein
MRPNPLAALLLLQLSCGTGDGVDIRHRELAYKHGPPPGAPPYSYFLTAYGGPSDGTAYNGLPACGGRRVNGAWYYSTGAYSYGCGAKLKIEANGKCVVVRVVDNGPAEWVEAHAQQACGGLGYIIDASPLVSKYLFGTGSAGWSDCYAIQVTPITEEADTGPVACAATWSGDFVGDSCAETAQCTGGTCLTEAQGYPSGMCSQSCTTACPDRADKASTFCVELEQAGLCVSRCDTTRYFTGCRTGYRCVKRSRFTQPAVKRNVCVPDGKGDLLDEPPDSEGDQPNPESTSRLAVEDGAGCSVAMSPVMGLPALLLLAALLGCSRRGR